MLSGGVRGIADKGLERDRFAWTGHKDNIQTVVDQVTAPVSAATPWAAAV